MVQDVVYLVDVSGPPGRQYKRDGTNYDPLWMEGEYVANVKRKATGEPLSDLLGTDTVQNIRWVFSDKPPGQGGVQYTFNPALPDPAPPANFPISLHAAGSPLKVKVKSLLANKPAKAVVVYVTFTAHVNNAGGPPELQQEFSIYIGPRRKYVAHFHFPDTPAGIKTTRGGANLFAGDNSAASKQARQTARNTFSQGLVQEYEPFIRQASMTSYAQVDGENGVTVPMSGAFTVDSTDEKGLRNLRDSTIPIPYVMNIFLVKASRVEHNSNLAAGAFTSNYTKGGKYYALLFIPDEASSTNNRQFVFAHEIMHVLALDSSRDIQEDQGAPRRLLGHLNDFEGTMSEADNYKKNLMYWSATPLNPPSDVHRWLTDYQAQGYFDLLKNTGFNVQDE